MEALNSERQSLTHHAQEIAEAQIVLADDASVPRSFLPPVRSSNRGLWGWWRGG
ncbi:MAG: hypothetical protein R2873_17475 [Caldilineaceae bacterium]